VYKVYLPVEGSVTNAPLILRVCEGDEHAWEEFVHEHQQVVFRLAYLLLGDASEAEDIAQETFLHAFRALHSFDTTRSARPWLLQIAANLARNRRRSAGRYLHALGRLVRFTTPPATTIIERSAERSEAQMLWQAVKQLKAPDQQIIYLRYFLQLSEIETAKALGIAHGTVKSRLSRALERLRSIIARDFPVLREEREV
jgi:RNA polymerase sigma-70 factor (ECF subfamily)